MAGSTSFSQHRASKSKKQRSSFRAGDIKISRLQEAAASSSANTSPQVTPALTSPIITVSVGHQNRLFAAHEDVLNHSYYFSHMIKNQFWSPDPSSPTTRQINLPDESPEVFSAILEYLYKGDYSPRLVVDKKRGTWNLEQTSSNLTEMTVNIQGHQISVLRDTVLYCVATKYGLEELARLALRKQGLQSGVSVGTILTSARYAYAHTSDDDSKLRAHYLALIIRSRHTFKRSGTMQNEMEAGGKLFFDLFVAMVNHMDDLQGR